MKENEKPQNDNDENTVTNDILIEEDEESLSSVNTMQDTIEEMAKTVYKKYPNKTSNLSAENVNGQVRIDALNEYTEKNFGYRFTVLDTLSNSKRDRILSKDGYGLAVIIEFVKSIQASFEQHELPNQIKSAFTPKR